MKRRTSLVIAVVGMLGLLAIVGPVSAANRGVSIGEANQCYFFAPKTQYANTGDTVTWTNGTDEAHTVTSDSGSELDSGEVADAATFEHTFAAEGTFAYHCTIHQYMTAKVVVLAAGAQLPATDTSVGATGRSGSDNSWLLIALLAGLAVGGLAIRRFRPVTEG
jgi:plastocyanin